ncbi:MAG: hypothetical protein WD449_03020, partial [Candidatus Babeliales bacterium]
LRPVTPPFPSLTPPPAPLTTMPTPQFSPIKIPVEYSRAGLIEALQKNTATDAHSNIQAIQENINLANQNIEQICPISGEKIIFPFYAQCCAQPFNFNTLMRWFKTQFKNYADVNSTIQGDLKFTCPLCRKELLNVSHYYNSLQKTDIKNPNLPETICKSCLLPTAPNTAVHPKYGSFHPDCALKYQAYKLLSAMEQTNKGLHPDSSSDSEASDDDIDFPPTP